MDRRVPKRRGPKKLVVVSIALALIVGGAVSVFGVLPRSGELVIAASDLTIAQVQDGRFEDALPLRVTTAPLETVQIVSVEGGQVQSVLAEDGTIVKAGQALAILSNARLRLEVTSSETQIVSQIADARAQELQLARNRLDRDQAIGETSFNLIEAQRELNIRMTLHSKGFVSDAGLAQAQSRASYFRDRLERLEEARRVDEGLGQRQLESVRQSAARLQPSLGILRDTLDALTIRSPVAGRLTAFSLVQGQSISAGATVGQVDSELSYKLVADVDEFYLSRIKIGQRALAALDGRNVALTIVRIRPQVVDGRFQIDLAFNEPPNNLRRGQTLDIKVILSDSSRAVVVSAGPWVSTGGGRSAFVVNQRGDAAERRSVRLGRRNSSQVEVLEGLEPGDRIIISSYESFDDSVRLILRGDTGQ